MFERMEEFLRCTGIAAGDIEVGHTDVLTAFQNGEVAMMRGTGNEEAIRGSRNGEHLLMPYFGETEEDGWYLTYPAFQIAASARGTEDPERRQLILDIMTAMLNQDGQENIASGQNMIPYSHGVELELSPELDREQTCSVAVLSSTPATLQDALDGMGVSGYKRAETAYKQIITERLAGGRPLAGPTDYITLH